MAFGVFCDLLDYLIFCEKCPGYFHRDCITFVDFKGSINTLTILILIAYGERVGFVISKEYLASGPGTRLDHSRAFFVAEFY